MFRRRDEEEKALDAANTEIKPAANFGSFEENKPATAEKKESGSARSIFGVPAAKQDAPEAPKAAETAAPAVSADAEAKPASNLFARPAAFTQPAQTAETPKVATYKLSAAGALTPTNNNSSSAASSASTKTQTSSGNAMTNIDKIETEKRLTVGYGITLEGKISNCDKLIVYGYVNADLTDVKTLHISESGKFAGFAAIENAEISGAFEGDLIVENSIVINSTGKMSGKVTYGSIEIKPGGKFTGQIVDAADVEPSQRSKKTAKKSSDSAAQFTLSPEPVDATEQATAKAKEELFA